MDSEQKLPTIDETIAEIRRQLIAAQAASRKDADKNRRVPFAITEAEAELAIEAVRDGDGVRIGVIADGADTEAAHHVRIRFELRSRNAAMYEVSDDEDDDF